MNNEGKSKLKQYILIATYIIVLSFILLNLSALNSGLGKTLSILSPFTTAIGIAFVFNLPMKLFENKVFSFLDNPKYPTAKKFKRPLSIFATIITIFGLLITLIVFVIPQLVESVSTLVDSVPGYMRSFEHLINQYVNSTELLKIISDKLLLAWKDILQVGGQLLGNSLNGILNVTIGITSGVVNFILSLVLAIYMLASKETLLLQLKKFIYAFSKRSFADRVMEIGNIANVTFASFITGQCIEAVIIGFLCFIGMTILALPYALLISVIIGVTALIPIFGAFIGIIPSAFIIMIISPIQAMIFIIFIIVLQQFEGAFIYPKVVGGSIGLSAIWVMLAMLVGGSLFGFLGMLLGIPTFGVIYKLISRSTTNKLKSKDISFK